jgi:hypothetical protein
MDYLPQALKPHRRRRLMTSSRPGVPATQLKVAEAARTVLMVVLMTALGAGPVFAQTPLTAPPPVTMGEFVRGLQPGTNIKLKLTSGATVKGMLVAADDEAVTVRPKARIPEPLRRVMLSEIADAQLARGSMVGKTVAIGAAVGAGAAIGFLFLLVLLYGSD